MTGKLLEDGKKSVTYLHGGYGNLLPKIEEALQGQSAGYQVTLDLQPQDALGVRDDNLVQTISRSQFPPGLKVGGQLQGRDEQGQARTFVVKKIKGQDVFFDGTYPLAGTASYLRAILAPLMDQRDDEQRHDGCDPQPLRETTKRIDLLSLL